MVVLFGIGAALAREFALPIQNVLAAHSGLGIVVFLVTSGPRQRGTRSNALRTSHIAECDMAITYSNDPVQRVVLESWRGDIHAAEIRNFWTRMLADPVSVSIRRSLADVREAIPQLTAEELERIVDEVLIPGLRGRSWISAAVVATADQLRLTHRYRAAQRLSEVSVFSDSDTALTWLRNQELPT